MQDGSLKILEILCSEKVSFTNCPLLCQELGFILD